MIRKKTVLVLGAGASAPYGFPTAWELRHLLLGGGLVESRFQEIRQTISEACPNGTIADFNKLVNGSSDLCIPGDFRKDFKLSNLASIDAFLARRVDEGFTRSATRCIAGLLLACERRHKVQGDWYAELFTELIQEGEEVKNLVIVTFNYDRSLEFFLRTAYTAAFGKSNAEEWLKQIPIFHVYGSLGPLDHIEFGNVWDFEKSCGFIRLARERTECEQAEQIFEHLKSAETIAFLGFGFDTLNLHAIGIHMKRDRRFGAKVFATCLRLSAPRKQAAKQLITYPTDRMEKDGRGKMVPALGGVINWHVGSVSDLLHNECVF